MAGDDRWRTSYTIDGVETVEAEVKRYRAALRDIRDPSHPVQLANPRGAGSLWAVRYEVNDEAGQQKLLQPLKYREAIRQLRDNADIEGDLVNFIEIYRIVNIAPQDQPPVWESAADDFILIERLAPAETAARAIRLK